MSDYNLKSLKLPVLTGAGLKVFTTLVESPLTRFIFIGSLLENGGIPKLRKLKFEETPTFFPLVKPDDESKKKDSIFQPAEDLVDFPYRSIKDYTNAYKSNILSPVEAAEAVIQAIRKSEQDAPSLNTFVAYDSEDILQQAKASADRYKTNHVIGPLDGVPIAIKDEIDMKPYPTNVGTSFMGTHPADEDSTVAAKLRAAGAILVGKTNMHEIGINPNGCNANFGAIRNPYDTNCDTGGSSSGSGAAVAAGLVPVAIGADGGGSIRIPAALCGVVGMKPTFARVSEHGAAPLCWSVAHLGPLTACVEDNALIYSVISGPDETEPNTLSQPSVTLEGWNKQGLQGIRLGIYKEWFEHASPEVVKQCYLLVDEFKKAGGEIIEITIPELDEMRIAHATTILSEMALCMRNYHEHHKEHGTAVRLSLILGEEFTAMDYIQAQRMRTRAMSFFADVFEKVDVILTPGTALAAQPVPAGGYKIGWSDLGTDTEMMRFVFASNFTGNPAITFPVGYDQRGMPISMQAIGRHWDEALLYRVAYNAEKVVKRIPPKRFYKVF
jgi:Asp-tRNA(Asn)/Glu-tRNA(Gln) amidotransferase A subunit family amidase